LVKSSDDLAIVRLSATAWLRVVNCVSALLKQLSTTKLLKNITPAITYGVLLNSKILSNIFMLMLSLLIPVSALLLLDN
jgi:hypothetical protein